MLKVERIRLKFHERNDLENLDVKKAWRIKKDMRLGRRKLRNLGDHEPLKAEAIELFEATIKAMDALIKDEGAAEALEYECTVFQRYVDAVKRVMR